MEDFIERSNALLAARPKSTRISTRYTHKRVANHGDRVDPSAKPAKFVIKTYDPKSGLIYKYKVKKANELSRILASIGPLSFEFGAGRKRGAASIMSDTLPVEPTVAETHEPAAAEETKIQAKEIEETKATAKSKKKKSKKN